MEEYNTANIVGIFLSLTPVGIMMIFFIVVVKNFLDEVFDTIELFVGGTLDEALKAIESLVSYKSDKNAETLFKNRRK